MGDPFRFGPWVSDAAKEDFRAEAARLAADPAPAGDIAALRTYYDAFNRRHLDAALANYPVTVEEGKVAGVAVHHVRPPESEDSRILICLHGGAFMWGAGAGALLEAVPVAAVARVPVVAVDYALAPEHVFPVAVDEVVAVYRALLERIPASRIGIYGCSAGAGLTAQVVARLIADGAALPGAIAMLHGAGLDIGGDSVPASAMLSGMPEAANPPSMAALPYFAGADPRDPLVFPGEDTAMLARFPPSLLVTGTRDFMASAVTVMHRRLLAAGADATLLHFDGMGHAHHMATKLPESRETFAALARHFARHLG